MGKHSVLPCDDEAMFLEAGTLLEGLPALTPSPLQP